MKPAISCAVSPLMRMAKQKGAHLQGKGLPIEYPFQQLTGLGTRERAGTIFAATNFFEVLLDMHD